MLVHTPRGCWPIEDLAYGDKVLSIDLDATRPTPRNSRVLGRSHRRVPSLYDLDLGEVLSVPPEQRLWVMGTGWLPARSLARGMALLAWDGSRRTLRSLRVRRGDHLAQDLRVEHGRGYFVGRVGVMVSPCILHVNCTDPTVIFHGVCR